jgi:hypothetical protein
MGNLLREQDLLEKIRTLPADRVSEVEDFVDFLRQRDEDRQLTEAAARLSKDASERCGTTRMTLNMTAV